jgi:hypothetical protein
MAVLGGLTGTGVFDEIIFMDHYRMLVPAGSAGARLE